jgi:glycosyltransferase involved in cell wall biosynthesis
MKSLGYPTIVVAGEHALAGLTIPSNVTVMSNLSISQCHNLVQRARVNVVPIDNGLTASGQVTLIDAMMFGKAVVATRTVGTVDYVNDKVNGQLVAPNNADELARAVQTLWTHKLKRDKMGEEARKFVVENLSDQAAGESLSRLLDRVEKSR